MAKAVGLGSLLTLGAALLIGAAAEAPPNGPTAEAPPKGPTAAEKFKNIKVLKDLPADQLFPTMQEFTKALGGNCATCHVQGDFASDDKKMKLVARDMIVMVRKLNETEPSVHKSVTCFMCHHGQKEPAERAEDVAKPKPEAKPGEKSDDDAKKPPASPTA
jgi:hypothetical protein